MKLNIIQLSDIHFKEIANENPIIKRSTKIFDSIKNQLLDGDVTFLIVTGDISYSGQKSEFAHATSFFTDLIEAIKKYTSKACHFICIPGNHDCFLVKNSVRERVISSFQKDGFVEVDESIIDLCCVPQDEFFKWKDEMYGKFNAGIKTIKNSKLVDVLEYSKDESNIIFNCFNTAWVSTNPEKYGNMIFPTTYFDSSFFHNTSTLTVNLLHHPFNWQTQSNYRELKKLLEETGDIILSGHEHEDNIQLTINKTGLFTGYIETGALQDNYNGKISKFNILNLDLKEESYKLSNLSIVDENYIVEQETDQIKFHHRFNLGKKEFVLTKHFNFELTGSGAPFIQTSYGEINLIDEIYIHPDLRKVNDNYADTSIRFPKIINAQELFQSDKPIRFIFTGDESCGKTTLVKRLFLESYNKNLVPILLSGDDINEFEPTKFRKTLKALFLKQYEKRLELKFDELDNDRIVLIIDDFQKCTAKQAIRAKMVDSITKVYKNIIFTGNATILFLPFMNKKNENVRVFSDFTHFHILEFNVEQRHKLINKWNSLGRDDIDSRGEVMVLNEKADRYIKNLLSTNLLPSNPISILTLLQALEAQGSSDNIIVNSFDLFVGNSINKHVKKKDEYEFYIEFLTFYCYFLFEEKLKEIDVASFKNAFAKFLELGKVDMEFDNVLQNLIKAKVLRSRDNNYISLANKYTYYYFVAKHISQKLYDPYFKELVLKISKRVYREEFYNIILFLTHFSKEPFIIESLYENANELYKEMPISKLEDDIIIVNELIDKLPVLVVESINTEKETNEALQEKNEYEEAEKYLEEETKNKPDDENEDLNSIDVLSRFILAIKTFELLGKIVQKSWGAPNYDDKLKYSEATFNLMLRTLSFYFKVMVDNKEGLVDLVKVIVSNKKVKELSEIKEISNKFLFSLSYQASFGLIKRLSNSIGHPKLSQVYKSLIEKLPIVSYRLINLSIELDHYDKIPFNTIEEILAVKGFNKNYLPKFLVQNFVYNHIRMFPTNHEEKQKISNLVGISIKDQLVADNTSKEKK